jgi:hypothetical protein
MKIVRFIATLRPSTLITFCIWCIGAVAGAKWRKGVNPTGWFDLGTIHSTIVRTAWWPTIGIASFVGSVGAITIPGWSNIAHGLFLGALCSVTSNKYCYGTGMCIIYVVRDRNEYQDDLGQYTTTESITTPRNN